MDVLVACEESAEVREQFKARGHDAWSCDRLPSRVPGQHYQGDVRDILDFGWNLLIAHPPCTRLCNSGVRWLSERNLWDEMLLGVEFFLLFLDRDDIDKVCVENPVPHRYARDRIGRKYDQIIHPWQFGHREMKATCLWLKGLPLLQPTDVVGPPPKDPEERKKWAKVHRASPGPDRSRVRSKTYTGIAKAMAEQWG